MINFFRKYFGKKKKKLGLALGSGGAKGMAHVGVIRAFDEEGISFDVVSGSSIGSVVGGMYAAGYSSSAMVAYLSQSELFAAQTLVKLTLSGKTVEDIFSDVIGGANFDELTLPFAAVAADVFSGEQVVIKEGSVARAMRASSAIPPVLKAVELDGRLLVDGAYVNSVPADVARGLGADFVIGVNLSADLPTNELIKNALDSKYPDNGIKLCDRAAVGRAFSNIMLEPDLREFSSATVAKQKLEEMYEIGYETAKSRMYEIKSELKRLKII